MTRQDLKEKFNILGDNKDISLYRKSGEFTYGVGYCGNIALKNGKAIFNGKSYSTVEELNNALLEWEKSLPYPVDTYNPLMRKGCRISSQIIYHMKEKFGFEPYRDGWAANTYTRSIGPVFSLSFSVKDNFDNDTVSIVSSFGGLSFSQDVEDTESGIAVISSIINGETLMMAKDIVELVASCDEKVTTEIEAYVPDNGSFFGVRKVPFKDLMIQKLEKVLAQLKGEETD